MTNMNEREAILHATLLAVRSGAVQVDQAVRMLSPLLGGQPVQEDLRSLLGIPSDLPDRPDLHDLQKLWLDALRQAGDWVRVWELLDAEFATVEYGPAMDALAVLVASGVVEWEEDEVRLASRSC